MPPQMAAISNRTRNPMSVIAYNLLKCIDYLDLKGRCAFPIALGTRIILIT
jgi:hypothetical protein